MTRNLVCMYSAMAARVLFTNSEPWSETRYSMFDTLSIQLLTIALATTSASFDSIGTRTVHLVSASTMVRQYLCSVLEISGPTRSTCTL